MSRILLKRLHGITCVSSLESWSCEVFADAGFTKRATVTNLDVFPYPCPARPIRRVPTLRGKASTVRRSFWLLPKCVAKVSDWKCTKELGIVLMQRCQIVEHASNDIESI